MTRSLSSIAAILLILPLPARSAEAPLVTLGGEVGAAADACINRFRTPPFDSLPWLRADLTGEKVSEFDDQWHHIMSRPFKQYSGDISGRFIEIMAMNSRGSHAVHPAFKSLLEEALKHQRPGGYFCASGTIDWKQPIDYTKEGTEGDGGRMMPALWGNARILCGLVETMRNFPEDKAIAAAALKLGDFYVGVVPSFTDPARVQEYTSAGSYCAGYVTCWFPAMEGLAKLSALTGERKYLDAAITIAAFYTQFDRLPVDHAHGMLCNHVSLVLLYEATKDASYLSRVEKRWDELVTGGYVNPAGGILEKCWVSYTRDEGCAIVDWLRLNLALGRVTGKARYWAMAERTLHNHLLQNQSAKGGFGHRKILCDDEGAWGFEDSIEESTWCCTYHGELGFVNLRAHLVDRTDSLLTSNFALDFIRKEATGKVVSVMKPAIAGEVARQHIQLDGLPASVVRVRQPHWADAVTAVAGDGSAMAVEVKDGYCATSQPVTSVEFIFAGGVYAEDRHCSRLPNGPVAGKPFVIGYGPKVMVAEGRSTPAPTWPVTVEALKAQGLEPFPSSFRRKNCHFVPGLEVKK